MGKAKKRERQKLNKAEKQEERQRKETRKKILNIAKTLGIILIIPIIIVVAMVVNNLTDPDTYTAKITFDVEGVERSELPNNGIIEIALDNANAPDSVKHFNGFASNELYNGTTIHRSHTDFVIQGGDPNGDGSGQLGSKVQVETPSDGYKTGDVAWAKTQADAPGTAGSQFFIITGDEESEGLETLNTKIQGPEGEEVYEYGFLGSVTQGLDLAQFIEDLAPTEDSESASAGNGPPTKTVTIVSIEVFKNDKKINVGDLIPATTLPGESPALDPTNAIEGLEGLDVPPGVEVVDPTRETAPATGE